MRQARKTKEENLNLLNKIKERGWRQLSGGYTHMGFDLKDRTILLGVCYKEPLLTQTFSISTPEFDEASISICDDSKKNYNNIIFTIPCIKQNFPIIKTEHSIIPFDPNDKSIDELLQKAIEKGQSIDIKEEIEKCTYLLPSDIGLDPIRLLTSLALLKKESVLKTFVDNFKASNRMGFTAYFDEQTMERALRYSQRRLLGEKRCNSEEPSNP